MPDIVAIAQLVNKMQRVVDDSLADYSAMTPDFQADLQASVRIVLDSVALSPRRFFAQKNEDVEWSKISRLEKLKAAILIGIVSSTYTFFLVDE